MRYLFLILYYGFATYLPDSYSPVIGPLCNRIRIFCCRRIFKRCGDISTINRLAYFGTGKDVVIGDYSGIGARCKVPNDLVMGRYVMMAPEVLIFNRNHRFDNPDIPFCRQGMTENRPVVIADNVWIGERAIITSGRHVAADTVIAAGSVVTKDFPECSVIGGNPARFIKKTFG